MSADRASDPRTWSNLGIPSHAVRIAVHTCAAGEPMPHLHEGPGQSSGSDTRCGPCDRADVRSDVPSHVVLMAAVIAAARLQRRRPAEAFRVGVDRAMVRPSGAAA